MSIINFYNHIPKSMLNNAYNPNYDLHLLKIPFRMVVNSPSGGGKSNYILNLIHLFSKGNGTFKDIQIFTRNKNEPLYEFLVEKSNNKISIQEGLKNLPDLDKMDKKENHLVIFDDLVLEKNQDRICEYYIRARKMNCSIIYLSQSFYKIPKIIRSNCNYFVILKMGGNREVNLIMSEFSLGVSKDQLLNMYKYATNDKFNCLLIDVDDPTKKYRRNFTEILNPDDFLTSKT